MRDSSIALNRFGLGARLDDDPVTDARHWLLDQLGNSISIQRRCAVCPDLISW
jgi:hypothetical protein